MQNFDINYLKLNDKQKEIVDTIDGPVLVIAGPGSGKTQVLGMRVANIVKKTDTSPHNILCLTYTRSAAHNMRERLIRFMGADAYKVNIANFHGLCTEIIASNPEHFYKGAILKPSDDIVSVSIITDIIKTLKYDNKLSSYHPEQGYTYLWDIKDAIRHLKSSATTAKEFENIILNNKKEYTIFNNYFNDVFLNRLNKKEYEIFDAKIEIMYKEIKPIHKSYLDLLYHNYKNTVNDYESYKKWREEFTIKNKDGLRLLKDDFKTDMMLELVFVYEKYTEIMYKKGYFDFEDMIMDVIHTLKNSNELRLKLQEKYQYILVDEFQDTNEAQLKIIKLLTDSEHLDGKPNIMAVGDDDQAIYKFQGAEFSNIVDFTMLYNDVKLITLTQNYRSNKHIVESSLSLIRNGENRLENILKSFDKKLNSNKESNTENPIEYFEFKNTLIEYGFIAKKIKELLDNNVSANEISIISRSHKDLMALLPFLHKNNIPISYEMEQNVLVEKHILEIITIIEYLVKKDDSLLPKIFAFPFFKIKNLTLWNLSNKAYTESISWLDAIDNDSEIELQNVKNIIIELYSLSQNESAEQVIDYIINKTEFRNYYFNQNRFENEKSAYLVFLSNLRVFVNAIRNHKNDDNVNIEKLIEYVEINKKYNLKLNDKSPFVNAREAVSLLTAHKSKGLEFEYVFILNSTEDSWIKNNKNHKINFPLNLNIKPSGDNMDDKLRLYFVALTRAKEKIYITSSNVDNNGKELSKLSFIHHLNTKDSNDDNIEIGSLEMLESELFSNKGSDIYIMPNFLDTEKALLKTLTDNYVLSVTHINNFLNIKKGGPMYFFEQNLLHFPESKNPSSAFGTCIHEILNRSLLYIKNENKYPALHEVKAWYDLILKRQRLLKKDEKDLGDKGNDIMEYIYNNYILTLNKDYTSEINFKAEGVHIDEVPITGKIDLLKNDIVVDYKTGNLKNDKAIKLNKYKNQIIFYYILIQNSHKYKNINLKYGELIFIEQGENYNIEVSADDIMRFKKIIKEIYKRIQNHDFSIPQGIEDAIEFEEYLYNL